MLLAKQAFCIGITPVGPCGPTELSSPYYPYELPAIVFEVLDDLAICRSGSKRPAQDLKGFGVELGEMHQVSVVKLLRAFGGCLGSKRRRRTW